MLSHPSSSTRSARQIPPPRTKYGSPKVNAEDGPIFRARREASALSLTETSFRARMDMGQLSRFERGYIRLSAERARNLDAVLREALRERSAKIAAATGDSAAAD